MEKYQTEGIVINAIPFRNFDCILTVFTPLNGLIKFFIRGAYSKKKGHGSGITNPLSIVEIIYTKGRGDLYICIEICVLNHNLALRGALNTLNAACEMIQGISATQQPEKSAPELYQLLQIYLKKLPLVSTPQTMIGSFRLKLLRYEGLLGFLSHCSVCAEILQDTLLHSGEAFCFLHKPPGSLLIIQEERKMMECLAFGRDLSILSNLQISEGVTKKIFTIFSESITS